MSDEHKGITESNHPDWPQYRADGHGRTDEQIRADVHEVLQREGGTSSRLKIQVADGIVTLQGELDSQSDLIKRIRDVPSVKDVQTRAS